MAFAPNPKFQAFDASGFPLVGGLLKTYIAGTNTPIATFTDESLTTENEVIIVLNIRGEADVHLSPDIAYKFILCDKFENLIWTVDNITAGSSGSGTTVNWTDIIDKPTTFPPSAHNQTWTTITNKPTTIAGYNITNAYTKTEVDNITNELAGDISDIGSELITINTKINNTSATLNNFIDDYEVTIPALQQTDINLQSQINGQTSAIDNLEETNITVLANITSLSGDVAGKAPIYHATSATTYGPADELNYGHAKLYSATGFNIDGAYTQSYTQQQLNSKVNKTGDVLTGTLIGIDNFSYAGIGMYSVNPELVAGNDSTDSRIAIYVDKVANGGKTIIELDNLNQAEFQIALSGTPRTYKSLIIPYSLPDGDTLAGVSILSAYAPKNGPFVSTAQNSLSLGNTYTWNWGYLGDTFTYGKILEIDVPRDGFYKTFVFEFGKCFFGNQNRCTINIRMNIGGRGSSFDPVIFVLGTGAASNYNVYYYHNTTTRKLEFWGRSTAGTGVAIAEGVQVQILQAYATNAIATGSATAMTSAAPYTWTGTVI